MTASAWVLTASAAVRFSTEALCGDARATVAGVGLPRLICVVQVTVVLLLVASPGAGASRAFAVNTGCSWRPRPPGSSSTARTGTRPGHRPTSRCGHGSAPWRAGRAESGAPVTKGTSASLWLAASVGSYGVRVLAPQASGERSALRPALVPDHAHRRGDARRRAAWELPLGASPTRPTAVTIEPGRHRTGTARPLGTSSASGRGVIPGRGAPSRRGHRPRPRGPGLVPSRRWDRGGVRRAG